MKKTNTTLAMVAVLAAVAMLSAVLAVPIQEASAEKGDRDGNSRDSGGNNLEIEQENECEQTIFSCGNFADVDNTQSIEEDGFTPPGQE